MTTPNEVVEVNIVLDAQKALIALADLNSSTTVFTQKLDYASLKVKEFGKSAGLGFGEAKETLQALDAALSQGSQTSLAFGSAGQEAWNQVSESSTKAGQNVETSVNRMTGSFNLLRTALHVLAATIVFGLINAFQQMFSMALNGLRELESATYNLISAEKRLSDAGIAITPKDLDSYIKKVQQLDPMLSKIQATELVSSTAIKVAPALGLTGKEIDSISQSVAILAVRNKGLGKSFEQVQSSVEDALLSGRISKGINDLGLKLNDQIVKENAVRMGLVATTQAYDALDGKAKTHIATLSIINELEQNTNQERGRLPEYFSTADGALAILQARMQDFFTQIGTIAAPIFIKLFQVLADGFQKAIIWIDKNKDSLSALAGIIANGIPPAIHLLELLVKALFAVTGAVTNVIMGFQKLIDKIPALKKAIELIAGKTTPDIANAPDTPTGTPAPTTVDNSKLIEAEQKTEEELNKIFTENRDKRADIDLAYSQKLQDIAISNQQKLEDIATKEAQATQDAYTNYNQKIQDIQISTQQKLADNKKEAHQKEVDAEQKHQDELKRLRDKYLFDLEDALHNRDARQILRLMAQYAMDKANADKSLKVEQAKIKQEAQLKQQQILQDQKQQEAAAKRDLQRKLADIQLAASRERQAQAINYARQQADAQLNYQRQLQAQQVYLQRKLRDLATAIQAEYNLTAAGMAAINSLISGYAGLPTSGGLTGTTSTTSSAGTGGSVVQSGAGTQIGQQPGVGSGLYNIYDTRFRNPSGLAEGGSFLATTPTKLNVAENRPELITATPLGRPGADVGRLFTQGGSGAKGGQIEIALTLSPDLEARVVRKSLDETANVVARINRSKV